MSQYEDIRYEVDGGIATITLDRPDKLNAWTRAMQQSVASAMAEAAADPAVRVILITGAGRGFCAGADMSLLQGLDADNAGEATSGGAATPVEAGGTAPGPDISRDYGGRFGYILRCPKPVIAAVNGPAAGLGLVVSLYADVRFAAQEAVFTTAFAQRGLVAEHGVSWLLPRLVGPAHAFDLLLSARKVKADEAERIGLVNQVFPQEGFMDFVRAYASHLVETVSPRSMAVMKAQIYKALHQDFNAALETADAEMEASFASDDFREGVAHFMEKRAPDFKGLG
ncbi:enoyl-CoA hydratase [Ectothiorhodospiraceae bacterium WFHF3C12]|nr:enoyl-CoA hydratase [Ectothiorhodospiraceae bacterium WFHF3C12]